MGDFRNKPEAYWREKLTPEQFDILRMKGTEAPFSGKLYDNHENGMYECAACDEPLFSSNAKFDSGSGWPSFDDPITREKIEIHEDESHGMSRTEVICKNCGSHLGHLFNDGPTQTGQRYCINSAALQFSTK